MAGDGFGVEGSKTGIIAYVWIALSLGFKEMSQDPQSAWLMSFLPDPTQMQHAPRHVSGLDLNSMTLDPSHLTAIMGLSRDLELMKKRISGAASSVSTEVTDTAGEERGGGSGRGKGRGRGKKKEEEKGD